MAYRSENKNRSISIYIYAYIGIVESTLESQILAQSRERGLRQSSHSRFCGVMGRSRSHEQ